jgi:2-polyprenyl-6-hydroxyphenyl methylase/3-demethylubiquinone-9 3-methyltransferase
MSEQAQAQAWKPNNSHVVAEIPGTRFAFGENWRRYLKSIDDSRIALADDSLRVALETTTLAGKTFLDIGSGSGLFSLAARRLGARVRSFDYDAESVACTAALRAQYFPHDPDWIVERGSVLDDPYLAALGTFDVVYSWGVLHQTGDMWKALDNVHRLVAPGGRLVISIYNDAGGQSARWKVIKQVYNSIPRPLRIPFAVLVTIPSELRAAAGACVRLQPREYIETWTRYGETKRGMCRSTDILDWVGGYPYEVAKTDAIFDFYRARGFELTKLKCSAGPLGCNEYVFAKHAGA